MYFQTYFNSNIKYSVQQYFHDNREDTIHVYVFKFNKDLKMNTDIREARRTGINLYP